MAVQTIGQMKVGDRLVFGRYTAGLYDTAEPQEIVWLKAEQNCDFIAENVLDFLCYDYREPQNPDRTVQSFGNPDFAASNICQFLNSCADKGWFSPQTEFDVAPTGAAMSNGMYAEHSGFLHHFEDYEVCAIDGKIRLPHFSEIADVDKAARLRLFRKKGVRAHASLDLLTNKNWYGQYNSTSWLSYYTDEIFTQWGSGYLKTIDRTGYEGHELPYSGCGIRPIARLVPATPVYELSTDTYALKDTTGDFEAKDFKAFFGF